MRAFEAEDARRVVELFLDEEELPVSPDYPCPYLPGLNARSEAFYIEQVHPDIFAALMDRGFRRSGRLIYRPACADCRACQPLRVPAASFRPSRSQRRTWRGNADLRAAVGRPHLTRRKWQLYRDYLDSQHDATMSREWGDLADFLYESPVDTFEISYRLGSALVGVSIVDRSSWSLNSVYMYFDPRHRGRSLGTYSVLWEIDYCRRRGIPYYYLGFCVAGCPKMAYKSDFGPCEVLDAACNWVPWSPQEKG